MYKAQIYSISLVLKCHGRGNQEKCLMMPIRGMIMKNTGLSCLFRRICLYCFDFGYISSLLGFCFCPVVVYNKNNLIIVYHLVLCPFSPSPKFKKKIKKQKYLIFLNYTVTELLLKQNRKKCHSAFKMGRFQSRNWQTFPIMGQIVNILSVAGHNWSPLHIFVF